MGVTASPETVALESADDIALADRLKSGRDAIIAELRKLIENPTLMLL